MIIRETASITAPVTALWEILQDPGHMPAWNEKCQTCDATKNVGLGSRFGATFRLGKNESHSDCEVVRYEPCAAIAIRYSAASGDDDKYVTETFLLSAPTPDTTQLILELDITHAPLPFWVKLVMWILSRCGRAVGRSSLDGLRDLVR